MTFHSFSSDRAPFPAFFLGGFKPPSAAGAPFGGSYFKVAVPRGRPPGLRLQVVNLRGVVYSLYERRLESARRHARCPSMSRSCATATAAGPARWASSTPTTATGSAPCASRSCWAGATEAGIKHVTLYLLATDNLQRAAGRARPARADHRGSRHRAGRGRQPLAAAHGRRARRAAGDDRDRAQGRAGEDPRPHRAASRSTWQSATAAAARSPTRCARCCTSTPRPARTLEELAEILDVEHIAEHLYTRGQPDPDLVIRTSGEQRLSGFLLWQSAHSEFYFHDANWPDFRRIDFLRALRVFSGRQRRYGA